MNRKEAADARERATGMRQSRGAMIAKIVFGALFLISGITTDWVNESDVSDPVGTMLFSIVLGLALIAWGVVPWLRAKKKREAAQAELAAEKAELAAENAERKAQQQAALERERNAPWTCNACGANTKGECCEYCGTPRPRVR